MAVKAKATITLTRVNDGSKIESYTAEFYLSTSKTSQVGGNWVTTKPNWEYGKYIWTRYKIVYSNPSKTEYTTPECDSSWEASNDVKDDLDAKITTNTKTLADLKIESETIGASVSTIKETVTKTNNNLTTLTETYNSFIQQNDQRFSLTLQQAKEYANDLTAKSSEIAKYFNVTIDGLELSAYDSTNSEVGRVKSLMSHDRFAIKFDDTEVMQIYKDQMKIDNIKLKNSLTLNPWIVTGYGSGETGGWVFRWGGF